MNVDAMKQMVEALRGMANDLGRFESEVPAIALGLTAIEAAEKQEPVAWIEHEWSGTGLRHLHFERREASLRDEVVNPIWTPLYTTPPAAQHQPLTDEEIDAIYTGVLAVHHEIDSYVFARAIEAAHNIKENK